MEENSTRWLALREAARRILVEQELIISVPSSHLENWQRLLLNIADSMPQRLEFPTIQEGNFLVSQKGNEIFHVGASEPASVETLWLPYNADGIKNELIQMCSELLLAGYPGCSGCGYRDEEDEWDEFTHRQRIKKSL